MNLWAILILLTSVVWHILGYLTILHLNELLHDPVVGTSILLQFAVGSETGSSRTVDWLKYPPLLNGMRLLMRKIITVAI
jgi:hypothetical protein